MDKSLPLLRVRLFGKEQITYGDKPILYGRNSITKAMKLLLILLHSGKEGITRNKLLEDLYGREELADVANNLRVTIHRLKKMLVEAGLPEYEYIIAKNGVYFWDSPMETEVDTEVFKELLAKVETEPDLDKRLSMRKEACQLYGGEFLQKLSGDEWVLLESVQYKNMYSQALQQVCAVLMECKEYEEALRMVEPACELYPFDEWQAVKIDCYIAMHRYKESMKEYERTTKLLIEELGVSPSERMMKQFKVLSEHISNRPQVIEEIKEGLRENPEERGAFFCTLPGFRDTYRVIRRGMERNGQSVFLMVCTLVDSKGRPMGSSEKLEEMSGNLYQSIKGSLRRCDSFTKYNQSQFLVLLMGTNEENCQIVIDRISNRFSQEHKSWAQHLQCSVSSRYDANNSHLKDAL